MSDLAIHTVALENTFNADQLSMDPGSDRKVKARVSDVC